MMIKKEFEMEMTKDEVVELFQDANIASYLVSSRFLEEELGGKDAYPCGFGWVEIYGIRANSKVGKVLAELGLRKDSYTKSFVLHTKTPNVQNMDVQYAGARAAAEILTKSGFRAYATSRMD
jgi:hypothetical protein